MCVCVCASSCLCVRFGLWLSVVYSSDLQMKQTPLCVAHSFPVLLSVNSRVTRTLPPRGPVSHFHFHLGCLRLRSSSETAAVEFTGGLHAAKPSRQVSTLILFHLLLTGFQKPNSQSSSTSLVSLFYFFLCGLLRFFQILNTGASRAWS